MNDILECGVDLIEIERVEKVISQYGERFLRRVWTAQELDYCRGRAPELAARFAAKEAAMKALGTGVTGLAWTEVEILSDDLGKPSVHLHGSAGERARKLGLHSWSVSLTHSRDYACAVVVALGGSIHGTQESA